MKEKDIEEDYFLNNNDAVLLKENSNKYSSNNKNNGKLNKEKTFTEELFSGENRSVLSQKGRNIVFILFLISNILISMDHGSIPASVNELRQLTTYDQSIGLFGSLVYFGNIIGSIIFFQIINNYSRKTLLLIALFGNTICLFTFVIIENILFLFLNRIIVGTLQSYITIYMPVWCNQYGLLPKRNMMIALIQLVSPIGIFLGYFTASMGISAQIMGGWKFAFIIQSFLILLLTLSFVIVPSNYLSKNWISIGDTEENEKIIQKNEDDINGEIQSDNLDYFQKLKILMEYKVFIFSVMSMSTLIYVITGVQYWITDYLDSILGVKSQKDRLFLFTVACFTAPVIGVFLGTMAKNKFCKTNMQKSLIFCSVLAFLACVCSIPAPLTLNLFYFIVYMWLILFFGGGIVPILTSIIINSVPEDLIASGNSLTNLITNALGYLPAPYVYGILSDIFYDQGRLGMKVTLWISLLGMLFSFMGTYYSFKDDRYKNKLV